MNNNKLSRFLLSASAGIIATLGISEVSALTDAQTAVVEAVRTQQNLEIQTHRASATAHFKASNPGVSDAKALEFANTFVADSAGLSALNGLGGDTKKLFDHFNDIFTSGISITADHYADFATRVLNSDTLSKLGVSNVRELKSPAIERMVAPDQVTSIKDAVYFAKQRKDSGEFKSAAEFFVKARDLSFSLSTNERIQYAEEALKMYSEHFIHHVARVSSVTTENVVAAQSLLTVVKKLAEETNTVVASVRAASCAEELGTAIYDLALVEKAARVKLEAVTPVDAAAVTAAKTKVAKLYVDLYNADIIARDMYGKAAALAEPNEISASVDAGHRKNAQLVRAADAMRLAVGALADAAIELPTAAFATDVTVKVKLNSEAQAFKAMYTELANNSGVSNVDKLKTDAASAKILGSKLKAIWNARSVFATGDAQYAELGTKYAEVQGSIETVLASANGTYTAGSTDDHYLAAKEISVVRFINGERLYRIALDADNAGLPAAATALSNYVRDNGSVTVVVGLDEALKKTLDEKKAEGIRNARRDTNKTLADERALVAKVRARELIKLAGAVLADDAARLESYLERAREANNKAAWEEGVKAADALLAVAAINTPAAGAGGDAARLVKALALTAKAEAFLKRNVPADDILTAGFDANGALSAGFLFDANATATAIDDANRASRIKARNALRKAFELSVELYHSIDGKQGLRNAWAAAEEVYANDEIAVGDAAVTGNVINGNTTLMSETLGALVNTSTPAGLKGALGVLTTLSTVVGNGANTAIANGGADYLEITVAGTRYVTKAVADVSAVGLNHAFEFEAAVAGAPAGGATVFSIALAGAPADIAALRLALAKCVAGAGQAGTVAHHFNALAAAPATAIDGVSLDSLDSVTKVYNHLVSKFASIRSAGSTSYKMFEYAAKAFEHARKAKAEWAAEEVKRLSSATAANYAAKRDAAGAAYTAAADYETLRLRALRRRSGRAGITRARSGGPRQGISIFSFDETTAQPAKTR